MYYIVKKLLCSIHAQVHCYFKRLTAFSKLPFMCPSMFGPQIPVAGCQELNPDGVFYCCSLSASRLDEMCILRSSPQLYKKWLSGLPWPFSIRMNQSGRSPLTSHINETCSVCANRRSLGWCFFSCLFFCPRQLPWLRSSSEPSVAKSITLHWQFSNQPVMWQQCNVYNHSDADQGLNKLYKLFQKYANQLVYHQQSPRSNLSTFLMFDVNVNRSSSPASALFFYIADWMIG